MLGFPSPLKHIETLTHLSSKRVFDIATASLGILLFAPVATTIASLIFLEDQGNILFTQERIGRNRHPFKVFKFRSMQEGKVTRIGRWLRGTGLDELPQFINVLRGEMSMVGPRPLTQADIIRLGWEHSDYDIRWVLPPGITGLAQLGGQGNAASSYQLDVLYLHHSSLILDGQLLVLSFAANLFGKKRVKQFISGEENLSRFPGSLSKLLRGSLSL